MKILVVGKTRSVAYWTENMVDGLRQSGLEPGLFSVNEAWLPAQVYLKALRQLDARTHLDALAARLTRAVRRLAPDLVFFTHAFWSIPLELYQALHELPSRPRLAGWVGDRFDETQRDKAHLLDRVYFTDTSFVERARALDFPDNHVYLPLAANTAVFHPLNRAREPRMLLVANSTAHRRAVVAAVRPALELHGKGWEKLEQGRHHVGRARLQMHEVAELYNRYLAVLNIINEKNLGCGANQRAFEALACRTPVVNDPIRDLARCFEPDREILVYRDVEELNALYRRLLADRELATRVGEAGHRRVLREHTYGHRVRAILRDIGG